jgi:antitoxin HicB
MASGRAVSNRVGTIDDMHLGERGSETALATKRLLAGQILRAMKKKNVSQAELARRMRTSRAVIHRLLDENDSSVTLSTISKAAAALGRGVRLRLSA